jgi:hypothetical protein
MGLLALGEQVVFDQASPRGEEGMDRGAVVEFKLAAFGLPVDELVKGQ